VVFAPLWEVLSNQRKVAIKFFHRLKNIGLSADKRSIQEIVFSRQVDLSNGNYEPLVDVKNLKCWPSEPDWLQIKDGDQIKNDPEAWNLESVFCTYKVEDDVRMRCDGSDKDGFDVVILAIPPESLAGIGVELLDKCPKIRKMHAGTNAVPTQSVQIWRQSMGSTTSVNKGDDLIGTYAEPFNTIADMSHLTPREDWGAQSVTCEYYCGPMEKRFDAIAPKEGKKHQDAMTGVVAQAFAQWSKGPGLPQTPHIPQGKMASQFNHANFDPSELYVQTLPGTVDSRLDPGDSGLDNLYLAGDWTRTSINGGSAEAAFESGRRAADLIAQRYCAASKPKP